MDNIELYGFNKVKAQYDGRMGEIEKLNSSGERTARIMAWNAFTNNQIKLDEANDVIRRTAFFKYEEAEELNGGHSIGIDTESFSDFFLDETFIINKRVTSKKVQVLFYIFIALALFGLYSIFAN